MRVDSEVLASTIRLRSGPSAARAASTLADIRSEAQPIRHIAKHPAMDDLRDVADLHLIAAVPGLARQRHVAGQLGSSVTGPVITGRCIGAERLAETAEQAPQRLSRHLAHDVPKRDVDARQSRDHRSFATMIIGGLIDLLPQELGPARVFTDQQRRNLVADQRRGNRMRPAPHRRLAPTIKPVLVGQHLDQQRVTCLVAAARIGQRIGHGIAQRDGFDCPDPQRFALTTST